MDFFELYQKMQSVNYDKLIAIAVVSNEKNILILQKDQLRKGETKDGSEISPKYSRGYYSWKRKQGTYRAKKGTPDLYLTGRFSDKMFVDVNSDVKIDSLDSKRNKLVYKYGKGIFDLQENNLLKIQSKVGSSFIKEYKRHLGL